MKNQGLGTWIARRRVKSEGDVAIVAAGSALRYEEFHDRIARLANALVERGVGHGDRVAHLGNNHPDFLTALFACGAIGAVFVPLNTRLAPRELEYMLEDSGARVLITHDAVRDLARAAAWQSRVTHRLVVDGPADLPAVESFDDVIAAAGTAFEPTAVGLDDAAMILYTSGTTGRPKGAILTHGNLTWNTLNVLVDYDVTSEDVSLMISPMFHVAALSMGVLPTLLKGGTVVLHEKFEPAAAIADIERYGVTSLSGVPTTFQLIAEDPAFATADLSTIRKLTCGGSAVPTRVIEAWASKGLAFSSGYGMTETSPGTTALPYRKAGDHVGTAGLTHFFTEVRIVGDDGAELPAGSVGEIQIAGPNVSPGYWNRPEATADSRTSDGWFRSGDLGSLDDDGYLVIADRLKDMIISGGENIYPAEVEQLVMELPEVHSVAIIGVHDERWGEVPLAVVELVPGARIAADAVLAHLAGRVARYKTPKHVVFIDGLPRTASGKVRKAELRERFPALPTGSLAVVTDSFPAQPVGTAAKWKANR